MDPRQQIHKLLKSLFDSNPHVYFQPPSWHQMSYPCIVYRLSDIPVMHADNCSYTQFHVYEITVIDRDSDSVLREKVANLKKCRFNRSFVSDNLHHFVFRLYQ